MYTISIITKSNDRVITVSRINSGQESMAGLDDRQRRMVEQGYPIFLKGIGPVTEAVVELHTRSGSWEYKGLAEGLPNLDTLEDDDARKAALDGWAQSSILLASYGG